MKKQRTDQFKSDEELFFSWWLDELKEAGIIYSWAYEFEPYVLSEKVCKDGKTLLQSHSYIPDFFICWSFSYTPAVKISISGGDNMFSLVDIKGKYSQNYNDAAFPLNQKWMMQRYGIYVNKVIPIDGFRKNKNGEKILKKCLFSETFTPKKYLLTPTGKARTIHWEVKTIEQFLEEL
jgi:hypothetical protein